MRQHKVDSWMESITSTAIGFIFSMMIYIFVVNPLFDLESSATESFWITCIFTVASILRQFFIRRLFDGKSVYEGIRSRSWLHRSNSSGRNGQRYSAVSTSLDRFEG